MNNVRLIEAYCLRNTTAGLIIRRKNMQNQQQHPRNSKEIPTLGQVRCQDVWVPIHNLNDIYKEKQSVISRDENLLLQECIIIVEGKTDGLLILDQMPGIKTVEKQEIPAAGELKDLGLKPDSSSQNSQIGMPINVFIRDEEEGNTLMKVSGKWIGSYDLHDQRPSREPEPICVIQLDNGKIMEFRWSLARIFPIVNS